MAPSVRDLLRRLLSSYVFYVVLGVVVGAQLAPYAIAFGVGQATDRGTVAVVPLEGAIDGRTAAGVSTQLSRARNDPDVEAVVLVVNSPGGSAAASESLYVETRRTAEAMPLVASVASAAMSGAYYATVPADHVYARPASMVGSVGTYATLPPAVEPIDGVVSSGPAKLRGGDERDWNYRVAAVQNAFLNAVMAARGDELTVSRETVARGAFYGGATAVQNGFVDEIGGQRAAVAKAAALAGLDSYRTEWFRPETNATFVTRSTYLASNASGRRLVAPERLVGDGDPAALPNLLLLPGSVVAAATAPNGSVVDATGSAAGTGPEAVSLPPAGERGGERAEVSAGG
ncbi:MAG: S49 family peptidase [Halobacteriaceae archaeon]